LSRRPAVRESDLKTALAALRAAGIEPVSLDIRPDGTQRWHFTKPADSAEDDLDRELEAFEAKHGYGRA
jgi:hypothetical protein